MKRNYLYTYFLLVNLLCILLCLQPLKAQFINGGFETWTTDSVSGQQVCNGWFGVICAGCTFMQGVMQSTDSHNGNYAARMYTEYCGFGGFPTPMGIMNGGYVEDFNSPIFFRPVGEPISFRPGKVTGYYKYTTTSQADSAYAETILFHNGDTIGFGFAYLPEVSTYTYFEVEVMYDDLVNVPDTISLLFSSNTLNIYPSVDMGDLLVDDLDLVPEISSSSIVQNGSFENSLGQPDFSNWSALCTYSVDSIGDTPPGGGDWSLKLETGNFQGCWPGNVVQTFPSVQDGEQFRLSVWVKNLDYALPNISIGKVDASGQFHPFVMDSTSSPSWTQLSISSIINLNPGDTAAILLNSGSTSGPLAWFAAFDLIVFEPLNSATSIDESNLLLISDPYPNPASDFIQIDIPEGQHFLSGQLEVYTLNGQKIVDQAISTFTNALKIPTTTWKPGMYICRLQTDKGASISKKIIIQ